ncbi:MAG: VanZ family protein [Aeromicrobium sp.]
MSRLAWILVGAPYVAVLLVVALSPIPVEDLLHIRLDETSHHRAEIIANIALFIPFGVMGTWLVRRVGWVIAAGIATSALIELAQLTWSPGRVAELADVVKNGLGTVIGCGLARAPHRRH